MEDTVTFGQWVKQRRKAINLTQTELGNLAFCSAVMIKKIEANERHPSIQVAKLLARYLKIAPKDYATFLSLARPDLSSEQIDEILMTYENAPGQPVAKRVNNLPVPMTPLIGRTQEVQTICGLLLDPYIRLVTLTGAGGMGKTRLSLQVASEINKQFVDGCWFISLAALEEPDQLIPTIARGLGVKESRHQAFSETLLAYLAERDMLIVLDNFEQILQAARKVSELLALAPRLKILVTSRTTLHLSGEHEFVVPPLRFVDPRNASPNAELTNSPAVALFVQKARAVNIGFTLTPENSTIVAKICARLDGLPLAIELAASRSKFLSPASLLARLEGSGPNDSSPLSVLADGAQDLPARHQTMRRAIEWSYHLLSKSEQDLFRSLAVFVGGCTLDAAAAVCVDTANDYPVLTSSVQAINAMSDKLTSLVAQSMLRQIQTADDIPRFTMLESLREYALEQLSAQEKEWALLKRRHARYFMALAQAAEPKFEGREQEIWLDRLEAEHDNLQAALAWSCASEDGAEIGLLLAGAVWQFWLIRGYVNEGRTWLMRVLEHAKSAPKLARARALNGAGFLNWAWSDAEQANALLHQSLSIFSEMNDKHGRAWVLNHLGHVALTQDQIDLAYEYVTESLALFRELGAEWNIAWDLLNMGHIFRAQGDETQAIAHYRESLELFSRLGDYRGTAWTLDHLGRLAYNHQDYQQTMELMTESLNLFRKVGDKRSMAWVLNHLGGVALAQHDFQQARFYVDESLALFREMSSYGNSAGAALDLGRTALNLGDTAWKLGETDRAKVLFTESLKLAQEAGDQQGINDALGRMKQFPQDEGTSLFS